MARLADLLSVDEARARILSSFSRLESETVDLEHALGRVTAEEIRSNLDIPPFANSSMDGFAVDSAATLQATSDHPKVLRIVANVAAGSQQLPEVGTDESVRIMTGAPLPPGTNAVIPFEEVYERGEFVEIPRPVTVQSCVRPRANDIALGQIVLKAGTEIRPAQVALLASLGQASVAVVRQPLVAVLSTGDELVSPGSGLRPGQIYNSNTPMLAAAIREAGGCPITIHTVRDDPAAIRMAIAGAPTADLLITSGGASVGDFDHVKDVVGESGSLDFWRVRVRPGKPLLFGTVGNMPVIGLPGNPTSAMVTFEQFARPAVRLMLGAPRFRPEISAVVDERIENAGGRRTYARVQLSYRDGRFHAKLSGRQDSAMLLPLAHADGLLMISEDVAEVLPGDIAPVQVWRLPSGE